MTRDTKCTIQVADGNFAEVTIYGCPSCYPTLMDRSKVESSIRKGKTSGSLYSDQPKKDTLIYGRWKKVEDNLKVGSVIEFSTAGKYNPGFHTTNKYTGEVVGRSGNDIYVQVKDVGSAVIPIKHIEMIISW